MLEIVARRRDALVLSLEEHTKWKKVFWGHEECWRTERIAAMEPRMYVVSSVIATWTASSEELNMSWCSMEGQFGEL